MTNQKIFLGRITTTTVIKWLERYKRRVWMRSCILWVFRLNYWQCYQNDFCAFFKNINSIASKTYMLLIWLYISIIGVCSESHSLNKIWNTWDSWMVLYYYFCNFQINYHQFLEELIALVQYKNTNVFVNCDPQ